MKSLVGKFHIFNLRVSGSDLHGFSKTLGGDGPNFMDVNANIYTPQ